MELTAVDGAIIVLSAVAALITGSYVGNKISDKTKSEMMKTLVQVGTAASVFIIGVSFFAPSVAQAIGLVAPTPEEEVPTVPVEQIQSEKIGYVLASVEDKYQVPTTLLSDALVYVSLEEPEANDSWVAVAQDNTGSTGSVLVEVPGVTSGTVYVTAWKSGYYSDFTTTTVPGAQEMPTSDLMANIELTRIGSISVTMYDNSNAYLSGNTIRVDNDATSAYITLDIVCDNVWMAIKDLKLLGIRGSAWSTRNVSLAPVIISDADLEADEVGDPTLTNSTTGGWEFPGDLEFGKTLRIRFTISKDAGPTSEELFRVSLDDLLGLKGYVGETGISETTLTFTT